MLKIQQEKKFKQSEISEKGQKHNNRPLSEQKDDKI